MGPVIHTSIDLASNESGQIQWFFTEPVGYYGDGVLWGDEAAINATDIFLNEDGSKVPQADSYLMPQIGYSLTDGNANGGNETGETVGENINRLGGKSVVYVGGISLYETVGANAAHSFGLTDDGKSRSGVATNAVGLGESVPLPFATGYYITESHPLLEQPIQLDDDLIPICQVLGQCGN
jgi:hypothetical protein